MYPFNRAESNRAQNAANFVVDMDGGNCGERRESTAPVARLMKIEQNGHAARRRSNVSAAETESDLSSTTPVTKRKITTNGSLMEESKNVLADLLEISFSRKSWNFRADRA
jgi:galactokinase